MIHHNTIATYQKILSLNNEMLIAAEAGNYDVFFELVVICNQAISNLKKDPSTEQLSQAQVESKVLCLQHMLAQDVKISKIMNRSIEKYLS